jgi:hypothetical protein
MIRRMAAGRTTGLALAAALALAPVAGGEEREARVSLDLKDAPVVEVVSILAEVGGLQMVFDPGITCRLTMKLNGARWRSVLDTALSACGLGREEEGDILRVATVSRLKEEAAPAAGSEEEDGSGGSRRVLPPVVRPRRADGPSPPADPARDRSRDLRLAHEHPHPDLLTRSARSVNRAGSRRRPRCGAR